MGTKAEPRARQSLAQLQGEARAAAWNREWPPGTPVLLIDDLGDLHETATRSVAWTLALGPPVVKVDGRTGGYALARLVPIRAMNDEQWEAEVRRRLRAQVSRFGTAGAVACVMEGFVSWAAEEKLKAESSGN